MNKTIITIGRQKGSGGHYIGELLAKRLGIKCYDDKLLLKTAEKNGFSPDFIKQTEETKPSSLLYTIVSSIPGVSGSYIQPLQDQVFFAQSSVIREIADAESCIFIGRCADYVLRERTDVINCFLHAPLHDRIERTSNRYPIENCDAQTLVCKTDKERAEYYRHFTDHPWGLASNYHLCLDTHSLTLSGTADVIETYLKVRNNYHK